MVRARIETTLAVVVLTVALLTVGAVTLTAGASCDTRGTPCALVQGGVTGVASVLPDPVVDESAAVGQFLVAAGPAAPLVVLLVAVAGAVSGRRTRSRPVRRRSRPVRTRADGGRLRGGGSDETVVRAGPPGAAPSLGGSNAGPSVTAVRAAAPWTIGDAGGAAGVPVLVGWRTGVGQSAVTGWPDPDERADPDERPGPDERPACGGSLDAVVLDAAGGITVQGRGPVARGVFRAIVLDLVERCPELVGPGGSGGVELRAIGDDRIAGLACATEPPDAAGEVSADQAVAVILAPDPVIVVVLVGDDARADARRGPGRPHPRGPGGPHPRGPGGVPSPGPRAPSATGHGSRIVVGAASCTVDSSAFLPRFPRLPD
ncbi:hypothetical protein ASF23_00350 [Curtobacterium sp. Leaf261]|nr:hypothetical protein ASF23_00350 [Curtobacterium sp. Leaf261]